MYSTVDPCCEPSDRYAIESGLAAQSFYDDGMSDALCGLPPEYLYSNYIQGYMDGLRCLGIDETGRIQYTPKPDPNYESEWL